MHRQIRAIKILKLILLLTSGLAVETSNKFQLIGWHGDTFDIDYVFGEPVGGVHTGPVKISEEPLAYVWKDFVTREEARHIAQLAAPRMKRSGIGGVHQAGKGRTSYGMFIPRYQDATIARVEHRVSEWVHLPVVHQEDIQVLRYEPGQRYSPHMDAEGRMCTILIYLAEPEAGGETAFPATTDDHWLDLTLKPEGLSADCAEGHVAVKPEIGTALLFYSMPPGAESDEMLREVDSFSKHTGCPPIHGVKWTATIWVHFNHFRPDIYSEEFPPTMPDLSNCADHTHQCKGWAEAGECEANAEFMLGTLASEGHCRLACGACTPCPLDDTRCLAEHRAQQGYLNISEEEISQLFNS